MRAANALATVLWLGGTLGAFAGGPLWSPRPMPRPEPTSDILAREILGMVTASGQRPQGVTATGRLAPADRLLVERELQKLATETVVSRAGTRTGGAVAVLSATGNISRWKPGSAPVRLPSRRVRLRKPGQPQPERLASRTPLPPVVRLAEPPEVAGPGLCGDPRIQGVAIAPIRGPRPGCGIANPVRITSIAGVTLSQPSIMECNTARAFTQWITGTLKPDFDLRGGGVKSIKILSHYSCRTMNSRPGAKLSLHAKGEAIDVGAITLNDGREITIRQGWRNPRDRLVLRRLHDGACGPFGTVLGPDANRYHKDHFHFDTAKYPGGPYCK